MILLPVMNERRTSYTPDRDWLSDIMIGAWEGARRFGGAAVLTTIVFGAYAIPSAEETQSAIGVRQESFNPDMGHTFGQYDRTDWVDCVEEPNGHAGVTLPSGDARAVVGVVGEMALDPTGANMPVLSDGAMIERQGSEHTVTPLWGDPKVLDPEAATRINLLDDTWIHVGTAIVMGQEQTAMTLYCTNNISG